MNPIVRKLVVAALLVSAALAFGVASGRAVPGEVTVSQVTVPGPAGLDLPGVLFQGSEPVDPQPAVVLLHGCGGMWTDDVPFETDQLTGEPLVDEVLEKWGRELASRGFTALAVDSFTPRTPEGTPDAEWQDQCGWSYDEGVSENTVRPLDAEAAQAWLAARQDVDAARIGLMGWSQGATAAMVTMGATAIDANVVRAQAAAKPFKAALAFYPGCGFKTGASSWAYGGTSSSYWRPYAFTRIYHGTHDALYDGQYSSGSDSAPAYPSPLISNATRFHCETRVARAKSLYGAAVGSGNSVELDVMPGAHHSFDYPHQVGFPTGPCVLGTAHPRDAEAECVFDNDALEFIQAILVQEVPPSAFDLTPPPLPDASTSQTAAFSWHVYPVGTKTECSLDLAAFQPCSSPRVYHGLAAGTHSLRVRRAGAPADSAFGVSWQIVGPGAPETAIDSGPPAATTSRTASFAWHADQPAPRFQCSLDGGAFAPCSTPRTYKGLALGAHTLSVRAVNFAGQIDPTPAVWAWTITPS